MNERYENKIKMRNSRKSTNNSTTDIENRVVYKMSHEECMEEMRNKKANQPSEAEQEAYWAMRKKYELIDHDHVVDEILKDIHQKLKPNELVCTYQSADSPEIRSDIIQMVAGANAGNVREEVLLLADETVSKYIDSIYPALIKRMSAELAVMVSGYNDRDYVPAADSVDPWKSLEQCDDPLIADIIKDVKERHDPEDRIVYYDIEFPVNGRDVSEVTDNAAKDFVGAYLDFNKWELVRRLYADLAAALEATFESSLSSQ